MSWSEPTQRKANLRLDIADSAYGALKESRECLPSFRENQMSPRFIIVLYQKIRPNECRLHHRNLTLSEYEIKLITKWIKQGAEYKPHWAFIAPQPQQLPKQKMKNGQRMRSIILLLPNGIKRPFTQ
jgi:hypothetical protein